MATKRTQQKRLRQSILRKKSQPSSTPKAISSAPLKMSDIIGGLAEPFAKEIDATPEQMEPLIRLTILAWNLALFAESEEKFRIIGDIVKNLSRPLQGNTAGETDDLAASFFRRLCLHVEKTKRHRYPHINHYILDARFDRPGDDGTIYFEVKYALFDAENPATLAMIADTQRNGAEAVLYPGERVATSCVPTSRTVK